MQKFSWKRIYKSILNFFSSPVILYILTLTVVMFALMYIIYYFELETDSGINNFFDAFWYTLVTITTVGYGDIAPSSLIGRLAGIVLLIFGVIAFAALSGKVASILFDKQLKKERGLINLKKQVDIF